MTREAVKIDQIEHHRNGVSGESFYSILFRSGKQKFIASVFDEPGYVSVICLDLIPDHGVTFGINSWRGDHYEADLRAAIAAHEAGRA